MAWDVYTVADATDIDTAIDALSVPNDHITESDDQLTAAKAAAKQIIASGGAGSPAYWNVALSGHANPGHAQPQAVGGGAVNEVIALTITATDENAYNQFVAAKTAAKENAS